MRLYFLSLVGLGYFNTSYAVNNIWSRLSQYGYENHISDKGYSFRLTRSSEVNSDG